MKTRYNLTNYMISVMAAFLLTGAAVLPAAAQHVEVLDPDQVIRPLSETVLTLDGLTMLQVDELEAFTHRDLTFYISEDPQEPPEIRIMNRIIKTALEDLEPPELPGELTDEEMLEGRLGEVERAYVTARNYRGATTFDFSVPLISGIYTGSRKVSGFYMAGYGYLFTIRWPIRSSSLLSSFYVGGQNELVMQLQAQNEALEQLLVRRSERIDRQRARADEPPVEAEEETQTEREAQQREAEIEALKVALEEWRSDFETIIVDALKNVIATYGHTLHQAATDESITFIFEQSDQDEDNITLSVNRGNLGGPADTDRAMSAIKVMRGSAEMNPALKSQIKIMAEIIDAAFEESWEEGEYHVYDISDAYFGGEARTQYIPGYGVIFRKNARFSAVNLVRGLVAPPEPPAASGRARTDTRRESISIALEAATEESRGKIEEHLDNLRRKTAEILATYGNTLTRLGADEWVGINYEVGSAAGLLQSGVSNFLVLARMSDVREAFRQGDAADWLYERLVTNEKPEN